MDLLGDISRTTIGESLDCSICGQHFTTAIRRQQHMTFHRPRNIMCYSCKNPEIQFPCYSAMVQHMMTGCGVINSRHIDSLVASWYQWNRVMIPEIRRKIREKKDLANAASYRLDDKLNKYCCAVCDKVFKLEKGAQMHAASNIHNPNIYRCPACKGEFPSFGALLLHAESLKCPLVIKLDSTLAKLLHYIHMKLAPIGVVKDVEEVIKDDLGVLVSKVMPPQDCMSAQPVQPAQPAPVSGDLIDLTDMAETIKAVENNEIVKEKAIKQDNVVDGNKPVDENKVVDEDGVADENKPIEEDHVVEAIGSRTVSTESLTLVSYSRSVSKARK